MSGTGKSKLVEVYAAALGLPQNQIKTIPVRPSWTDDADIIGYVDLIQNVYRPSDCGLIDFLIEAQENPNDIYIVCFDEMNLARVEHYFSQFLSVLESENKMLRLYNDDLTGRLYNSNKYRPTISINSNVLFVGTVNLDESTYHFSDKVLDRANVIRLNVMPFRELLKLTGNIIQDQDSITNMEKWKLNDYQSFKSPSDGIDLTERELKFFEEIHESLQKINLNFGVGPRVIKQIDNYLKCLPLQEELTRKKAFDLQIVQRLLTKIRGSEDQLKPVVGTVDSSGNLTNSIFANIINTFADISEFAETKNVLIQKAKELKLNGYTM